jgi:hypothetical protein
MTRDILNHRQGFRLRTLMNMSEYPSNPSGVTWLYAQGYSLSDYLVKRSDHRTFLAFVAHGMRTRSWDKACQDYFGLRTVEDLEEAWLKHLRDTRRGAPEIQVAQNTRPAEKPKAPTYRTTTLPPAQPLEAVPTFRGSAPSPDQVGRRFGDAQTPATPPIPIPVPSNVNNKQASSAPLYQPATGPAAQPQYVQQSQPRYTGQQYAQPQCNGPNCQQPYYQQQYNPSAAVPFGYPAPH